MTKEEMLEEAKYMVETNEVARMWFDRAQDTKYVFTTTITRCFDILFEDLIREPDDPLYEMVGWWYGRIVNPNRPKEYKYGMSVQ